MIVQGFEWLEKMLLSTSQSEMDTPQTRMTFFYAQEQVMVSRLAIFYVEIYEWRNMYMYIAYLITKNYDYYIKYLIKNLVPLGLKQLPVLAS